MLLRGGRQRDDTQKQKRKKSWHDEECTAQYGAKMKRHKKEKAGQMTARPFFLFGEKRNDR
jgi:hypothetical protein